MDRAASGHDPTGAGRNAPRLAPPRSADLFCRVVDNLGDAGVCWRLARQLAAEHSLAVRLYIDRPRALARIGGGEAAVHDDTAGRDDGAGRGHATDRRPGARPSVHVHEWLDPWPPHAPPPADLVIAAFACRLPGPYLDAMAARCPQPAWFNLEYLSAEDWVADAHGLASPRPDRRLVERFFFPGFDARTGGLLRERGLLARRDAFAADARAQAALCAALGIAPRRDGETLVSMFCYPHAPLAAWLATCRDGERPVRVLLPEGVGRDAFDTLFGQPPTAGLHRQRGRLSVDVVPIVPQPRYDELLWLCDLNFVRGEDSFVRAQWAGKPMVWHVYPQDGGADRIKLDAFLARYLACASETTGRAGLRAAHDAIVPLSAADAIRGAMHAWNGDGDIATAWRGLSAALPAAQALAARWCAAQAARPDLAEKLLKEARKML